jgi:hypothetical protein
MNLNVRAVFLCLFFCGGIQVFATSNKIGISGGFAPMLGDEATTDARLFLTAPVVTINLEYDISNSFNFVIPIQYSDISVSGDDGNDFTDDYIALSTGVLLKFYPFQSNEVTLLEGGGESILVESPNRLLNPFVSFGLRSYNLFDVSAISSTDSTQYFQRNLFGISFAAGVELPFNNRMGMEFTTESGSFSSLTSPYLFIIQLNPQLGLYYIFN